jgi:5-formyltetrahydrofolate cyclo-ligase
VIALAAFAAARHVVLYRPRDNEVDPGAVAVEAAGLSKRVYYPHPTPDIACFVAGASGAAFDPSSGEELPPDAVDVCVLVPGLAFDSRGVRLGRGGGWYDRALLRHPAAMRIGLAYDFQVAASLPEASWDVRMHAVATEVRLLGAAGQRLGQ